MDVRQAAVQIAEIQSRLTETQTLHGYRSLTVGSTGVVALLAAAIRLGNSAIRDGFREITALTPIPGNHSPTAGVF